MNESEAKEFLDKLAQNKRSFVEAGRKTGDWAGIERLVTEELYPDQSHFIFELLQNAEDAEATEIHFVLDSDGLIVWHDGLRLFNEKDALGITSIGQTQKRDDVNQIGKFGVGFKSVFAYTQAPVIHSGNFHFEINNLVVPSWVVPQTELSRKATYFHLPFNRPQKSPKDCFSEIAAGLERLPESTILFLRHISVLSWKILGKHEAWIKRKPEPDTRINTAVGTVFSIRRCDIEGKTTTSRWLRFDAPLKDKHELCCSIAFLLGAPPRKDADAESDEKPLVHQRDVGLTIQPLSAPGHLHIYFPAGKEPTGLLFQIHAPFAATVDRASIPFDQPENQSLILELASLCKAVLESIKDAGLLTSSFLAVLPNVKDELQAFYKPIRAAIIEGFKEKKLLPTHYGDHARASDVLFGPKELRNFFSDDDLKLLKQQENVVWCPGFRNSSRPDVFLDTLEVEAIDWGDFIEYWDAFFNPDTDLGGESRRAEDWLKKKMLEATDHLEWFRSLYRLLNKAHTETKTYTWSKPHHALRESPVVLTEKGALSVGTGVYFPAATVSIPGVSVEIANPSLFALPKAQSDRIKEIRSALEVLGVTEYDEGSAIKAFVEKISSQKKIAFSDHLEQLRCLLAWHTEKKITDYTALKTTHLFLDQEGTHYRHPSVFYIDLPFKETGLSLLYSHTKSARGLSPKYLDHFPPDVIVSFAEAVGVRTEIPFIQTTIASTHPEMKQLLWGWSGTRQTSTSTDVDWNIEGLAELLARNDPAANRILWNKLCKCDGRYFFAKYRPNASYEPKVGSSAFVHALRNAFWVLTKSGDLCAPRDVGVNTIAEGWLAVASNGWFASALFGQNAEKQKAAQMEREDAANKLGITADLADELASLSKEDQDQWLRRIRDARATNFPTDSPADPGKRASRAEGAVRQAKDVKRETRERSVRVSSNREDTRAYLEDKYTRDGTLFCQMSHIPMPFCLPDGRPFFEAVELFSLGKEIPSNHLCLSPTCAAEFRHALSTEDGDLRRRILDLSFEAGGLEILIDVPLTEHCRVRFVRSHLIDLQAALRVTHVSADDTN